MTVEIGNTTLTNTFDYWRNRTNELADAMTNKVVTVESNTAVGNAAISGTFTANVFSGNGSLLTSIDADTVGGNTASTLNSYADSRAGTAYTNAVSYAGTIAATAYSNAVSIAATDATNKAANAYSNATSYADTATGTAYTNAVSYAGTIAGTAYSNAVSTASADATSKAATAYSNATSYADTASGTAYSNSVSYIDSKTLSQATWETGTDTTEALVSPAKVAAAIDTLAGGAVPILRVYSSSTTWTKPAGLVGVKVEVWGAGGGKATGGTSSFGSLVVATGGGQGTYKNPGVGTTGQLLLSGGYGITESLSGGAGAGGGGAGGIYPSVTGSVPGGGGGGWVFSTNDGSNSYPGGGGGGYASSYIDASSLGSTIAVTVGAAGYSSNYQAGYGGAGLVIVTEYY